MYKRLLSFILDSSLSQEALSPRNLVPALPPGTSEAFAQEVTASSRRASKLEYVIRRGMIIGTRIFNENPHIGSMRDRPRRRL